MAFEILLIDDDPDVSVVIRTFLKGQDYQIRAAYSGQEGIEACARENPDIIILDLMLPDLTGWEVCENIRDFTGIPILILSALGSPGDVAMALDAGADDCLIKPVHASLLSSRLRALIRRHALNLRVRAA